LRGDAPASDRESRASKHQTMYSGEIVVTCVSRAVTLALAAAAVRANGWSAQRDARGSVQ